MNEFLTRPNQTLSLVVLTWLRQLQQFFCDKKISNKGDWNEHKKYCGTTTNRMGTSAPLVNINFCIYDKQQVLIPFELGSFGMVASTSAVFCDKKIFNNGDWIKYRKYCGTTTNRMGKSTPLANIIFCIYDNQQVLIPILTVEAFEPSEGKEGVCTSLEEWALHILKPKQEFQLRGLYEKDDETKMRWKRVIHNTVQATFCITDMDFTTASNGSESENKDIESLDTKAKRQQGKSNLELAKQSTMH
jgi:hypothetical protein